MDPKVSLVLAVLLMLLQAVLGGKNDVGMWSPWTGWSTCSLSCGSGITTRTRYWQQPPSEPKREEPFTSSENVMCNERLCPVDGKWNAWGRWGVCSEACGGGVTIRKRSCTDPSNGGVPCEGEDFEEDECNRVPCPPLPVRFNISACTRSKHFMCASQKMCIPREELCDQTVQCHDGSDEKQCYDVQKGGSVHYSYVGETSTSSRQSVSVILSLTMALLSRCAW